jgi:integrase
MAKITYPLTAIVNDLRRPKADKTYPVKLRITYQRDQKYYSTGIDVTKADYERMNGQRPRPPFDEYKRLTDEMKYKAEDLIKDMGPFSFPAFEAVFLEVKSEATDLQSLFDAHIDWLNASGKVGTAALYKNTIQSLVKFKQGCRVTDITKDWLEDYEKWMLTPSNHKNQKPRSTTIVSMYVRNLRRIINLAIENKVLRQDDYPFAKKGYAIPEGNNEKLAISKEDIMKIFKYNPPAYKHNENQYERAYRQGLWAARAYFCFSYLANGMNFKDIALLKNRNIVGDQIIYYRAKTTSRRKRPQPIKVPLTEQLEHILEALKGGNDGKPESYIFSILRPDMSAKDQLTVIRGFIKKTNKYLGLIGDEIGIDKFTTYAARHSFATILRNSGAPTAYIQEALGHEDAETTQNYLAGFPDDVKKKWAGALLDVDES